MKDKIRHLTRRRGHHRRQKLEAIDYIIARCRLSRGRKARGENNTGEEGKDKARSIPPQEGQQRKEKNMKR